MEQLNKYLTVCIQYYKLKKDSKKVKELEDRIKNNQKKL